MQWFRERKIVAPFDFSENSLEAVALAVQLAVEQGDVHVVHVIPPLVVSEPGVVWGAIDDASRVQHARAEMEKALAKTVVADVKLDVRIGDAGHQICELATDIGAGLIVIASHGRTGLSRVVLGSVAERVARHAHCPVLVVKPEKAKKDRAKAGSKDAVAESQA